MKLSTSIRLGSALLAAALFSVAAPSVVSAHDWPQFLGPSRDGVSAETGLLKSFDGDHPAELWRQKLGTGFSSFAVVDDVAYTMYAKDGGEYLVALRAENGKQLWRLRTGKLYEESQGGNGPRTTPTIANGVVYTVSALCTLYAVRSADGSVLWQTDLTQLGAPVPKFGCASSPLVDRKQLILNIGGEGGRSLVAFKRESGKLLWSSGKGDVAYASPLLFELGVRRLVLYLTSEHFVGVDANDGTERFRIPFENFWEVNIVSPLPLGEDRVLITHNGGTDPIVFRLEAQKDGAVNAVKLWQDDTLESQLSNAVYYEGHIYGFKDSRLVCVDAATGEKKWSERGVGRGTVLLAEKRIVLLTEDGELALLNPTPARYWELGRRRVFEGRSWTVPALSNGRLFLRNLEELVAVDLRATAP